MNDCNCNKKARKVYVSVLVKYDTEGHCRPYRIKFEDDVKYQNQVFKIERVRHITRAAATKVGGTGIRYTIVIDGKESFLFEDDNRWFIEDDINCN